MTLAHFRKADALRHDVCHYRFQARIVIIFPENIDAILALTGIETDGPALIAKTDAALGLVREFFGQKSETEAVPA